MTPQADSRLTYELISAEELEGYHFVLHSDLNGNNGEATNADDHDRERARREARNHVHQRPANALVEREQREPIATRVRRIALALDRVPVRLPNNIGPWLAQLAVMGNNNRLDYVEGDRELAVALRARILALHRARDAALDPNPAAPAQPEGVEGVARDPPPDPDPGETRAEGDRDQEGGQPEVVGEAVPPPVQGRRIGFNEPHERLPVAEAVPLVMDDDEAPEELVPVRDGAWAVPRAAHMERMAPVLERLRGPRPRLRFVWPDVHRELPYVGAHNIVRPLPEQARQLIRAHGRGILRRPRIRDRYFVRQIPAHGPLYERRMARGNRLLRENLARGTLRNWIGRHAMNRKADRLRTRIYVQQELPLLERLYTTNFRTMAYLTGSATAVVETGLVVGATSHAGHALVMGCLTVMGYGLTGLLAASAMVAPIVVAAGVPYYLYHRRAAGMREHHQVYGRDTRWERYQEARLQVPVWDPDISSYFSGHQYNGVMPIVVSKHQIDYILRRRSGSRGSTDVALSILNEVRTVFPPVTPVQAQIQLDTVTYCCQYFMVESLLVSRRLVHANVPQARAF